MSTITPEWLSAEGEYMREKYAWPSLFRQVREASVTKWLGEDRVRKLGIADIRYLSGADNVFFWAETKWSEMTVAGMYLFERRIDPEVMKKQIEGYVMRNGETTICKVVMNNEGSLPWRLFGRPYFELDKDFSIDRHFKIVQVPAPGDDSAIEQVCSKFMQEPWDMDHPLWNCFYLDGIKINGQEKCALWWSAHHATGDGQGFIRALLSFVATLDPKTGLPPPVAKRGPVDLSSMQYSAGNLYANVGGANVTSADAATPPAANGAVKVEPGTTPVPAPATSADEPAKKPARKPKTAFDKYLKPLVVVLATIFFVVMGVVSGLFYALYNTVLLILFARRKSLWNKRGLTVEKELAYSKLIPLDDVKFVKNVLKCSVNDVMLTATNAGLANFLASKNALKDESFTYLIPTSLRRPDDFSLTNQSTCWFVTLPAKTKKTSEASGVDVLEMVRKVAKTMKRMKKSLEPVIYYYILLVLHFFPQLVPTPKQFPKMIGWNFVSCILTNVPGPLTPVNWAGVNMERYSPIIPCVPGGVGMAILSYAGSVSVGVYLDVDAQAKGDELHAAGDARRLVGFFEKALEELHGRAKEIKKAQEAKLIDKKPEEKKED